MKIQGTISGVEIEIEVPDEIEREGVFYEPIAYRPFCSREWWYSQASERVWQGGGRSYFPEIILAEIPRPTQEWLDEHDWMTTEKPAIVIFKDTIYVKDGYGSHMRWISEYDDLIGKRRYHLTERIRKECFNCGEKI